MHWIRHYFHSHETESNKTVNSDNIIKWWTPNDFPNSEIFSWQSVAHCVVFFLFLGVFFLLLLVFFVNWKEYVSEKRFTKYQVSVSQDHWSSGFWMISPKETLFLGKTAPCVALLRMLLTELLFVRIYILLLFGPRQTWGELLWKVMHWISITCQKSALN